MSLLKAIPFKSFKSVTNLFPKTMGMTRHLVATQSNFFMPVQIHNQQFKRNACSHYHMKQSNGIYDKKWLYEKYATLALIGLIPATITYPLPILDYALIPFITYHHYVGCESVISDYGRPIIFGEKRVKLFFIINQILTFTLAMGLTLFVYNDIGIGNAVRIVWTVNQQQSTKEEKEEEVDCTNCIE